MTSYQLYLYYDYYLNEIKFTNAFLCPFLIQYGDVFLERITATNNYHDDDQHTDRGNLERKSNARNIISTQNSPTTTTTSPRLARTFESAGISWCSRTPPETTITERQDWNTACDNGETLSEKIYICPKVPRFPNTQYWEKSSTLRNVGFYNRISILLIID